MFDFGDGTLSPSTKAYRRGEAMKFRQDIKRLHVIFTFIELEQSRHRMISLSTIQSASNSG